MRRSRRGPPVLDMADSIELVGSRRPRRGGGGRRPAARRRRSARAAAAAPGGGFGARSPAKSRSIAPPAHAHAGQSSLLSAATAQP
jgi:hypothetical protein